MDIAKKLLNKILTAARLFSFLSLVGIILLVVINIVTRRFGHGILGTYEGVQLLIVVWVTFSLVYAAICHIHVRMDMLVSKIPKRAQNILYILTSILTFGIWALIAIQGGIFAVEESFPIRESSIVMEWPIYPFRFIFIIGLMIMSFVFLLDIIKAFKDKQK